MFQREGVVWGRNVEVLYGVDSLKWFQPARCNQLVEVSMRGRDSSGSYTCLPG